MYSVYRQIGTLLLAAMLYLAAASPATANQYYFVARQAPAGSLTAPGQSTPVVYLRWDVVEGALPPEVASLRLTRDGEVLLDVPVAEVKSVPEIAALYSGAAQQRRLLEIVLKLKASAVADDEDFSAGDFATIIHGLIDPLGGNYDAGWSFLASRTDINVAIARNRAFVDNPGVGEFEYELLAVDAGSNTARLGLVTVDTTAQQLPLGAGNFAQVATSQCDLPEAGRDHYTVALNWDNPNPSNVTDRFAAQVYLAGYDLWRTTDNLDAAITQPPARDIASEAAAVGHDSNGVPDIDGLELVNDILLTVLPDGTAEPEWVETRTDLERAGLEPGDRRAYYLVPRDFTGNYGPTSAAIVVVPNLLRPPAPWDVRPVVDAVSSGLPGGGASLALSWDDVNLDNYLQEFGTGRTFCNAGEAAATGTLEFVGEGESCATDTRRGVRVDISRYLVYRFATFETASRFKDSDGDGRADSDERESAPALQCDGGAFPAGATNYLLDPDDVSLGEVVLPRSGRRTVRLQDALPAAGPGEVMTPDDGIGNTYWYRVAAETPDGILSYLSAPQRGLVPDRTLPPAPQIEITTGKPNDPPIEQGEFRSGPLLVRVTADLGFPDVCLDLLENIGGEYARVETSCGGGSPEEITYQVSGGYFCGFAVARDGNNNVSPAAVAPCALVRQGSGKRPTTPQPVSINVDDTVAALSWRVPVEPIASTLISLEHRRADGSNSRTLRSYAHSGTGSGSVLEFDLPVAALDGEADEFCVSYQALAPRTRDTLVTEGTASGWSAPQCVTRRTNTSAQPDYLPWPVVDAPVQLAPLDVVVLDERLLVKLGRVEDEKVLTSDCIEVPEAGYDGALCNREGELKIKAVLDQVTPFLLYRQKRDASGVTGDWIEVSPLIEFAHFDNVTPEEGRDRRLADPFVRLQRAPNETEPELLYFDRYPYQGLEYRYQMVLFDADHRITGWRRSAWISPSAGTP